MGRRKLDQERRTQILQAFGKCVLEKGLDNSGISAVAREVGLSRPLVHHFVGTRDNLITMLAEEVVRQHQADVDEFWEWVRKGARVEDILADELDNPGDESATEKAMYSILNSARDKYPDIDNAYQVIMEGWIRALSLALFRSGRGENEASCQGVAATLVCIIGGWDMIHDLPGFARHKKELKKQLKRVVETLPKR